MPCAAGPQACIDVELALAFADGAVSAVERAEVERRIDACPGCRAAVVEAARADVDATATRAERPRHRDATATTRTGRVLDDDPLTVEDLLPPGRQVGRYVVERRLGAGGMGVIALARDPALRRAVVIKLVRPDARTGEGDDALEARLRREAQAMAQVSHTNVVQIFDTGRHGDRVFLAMEYVAGPTLDAWLIERPRTVDEILAVFRQAGAGLVAAHRAGLLHRDFKPSNVLIDRDGQAKVTDFGLARALGGVEATAPITARASGVHAVLTHHDAIVGTPAYMAPEQRAGLPLDARTDQYAFALALVDALLDQPAARRQVSPMSAPAELEAALVRRRVATAIARALVRALAADPAARFPSVDDLLAALAPPPRRRRWWLPALAATALAGGGGLALALTRAPPAACAAESPARWTAPVRAEVVAALARAPQPFAGWRAARVAEAVDAEVAQLAELERAICAKTASAGDARCAPDRRAALERAIAALTAPTASDDPWRWVRAIGTCAPIDDGAAPSSATVDERAADALIATGVAALAEGRVGDAQRALEQAAAAGERAGDDAARAEALRQLLALARWRGDVAAAIRDGDALRALVVRHGDGPRDILTAATIEIPTYTDLGEVARADAAIARAMAAATTLDDRDAIVRAHLAAAWARHALHFDDVGARAALAQARAVPDASPDAQAEALTIAARLALATDDHAAATAALAELSILSTAAATALSTQLLTARARATTGDHDGARALLDAIAPGTDLDRARVAITRGEVLHRAGHSDAAIASLGDGLATIRPPYASDAPALQPMPHLEQLEAALALCAIELDVAVVDSDERDCWRVNDLVTRLPALAPIRARHHLQTARAYRLHQRGLSAYPEEKALEVLVAVDAPPLVQAPVAWAIAQNELSGSRAQRETLARRARDAYAAAGDADQVAAIDAWLAQLVVDDGAAAP